MCRHPSVELRALQSMLKITVVRDMGHIQSIRITSKITDIHVLPTLFKQSNSAPWTVRVPCLCSPIEPDLQTSNMVGVPETNTKSICEALWPVLVRNGPGSAGFM